VEYTDQPGQDWSVSKVIKRGFARSGKVLRAEEVVVRRFKAEPSASDEAGES
jgi:molecular chaperone GrpE (heat shock protein)